MPTAETLRALLALVEEAKGADDNLDQALFAAVWGWSYPIHGAARYEFESLGNGAGTCFTLSVDNARQIARRALPDFWMSSGLCSLTGHASIGPDYNGPVGERLRSEWPEADFHGGFHADLAPGDGPHRECYAILSCMLQAMLARALLQQSETAHVER